MLRLTQTFGPGVALDDAPCSPSSRCRAVEGRDIVLHTAGQSGNSNLDTVELQGLG
ncbi:MAG TPA: hypothetical protein VIH08_06160 [Blastococcus sp.]